MKDIPKDMWRNKAYRYEHEKKQPYNRLRGSKIPYPNLHSSNFEMLVKTCTDEEIGRFMLSLYKFIYQGIVLWWYDEKMQNIWEDTLTKMNEKAEWFFKMKEEQKQLKELKKTISEEFDI